MHSSLQQPAPGASTGAVLENRTILRFAHAFETGGGTERYLDDLDQALLERNAMTVIRLHLTRDPSNTAPAEDTVGRGRLIRVPLQVKPGAGSGNPADEHSFRYRAREFVRDWLLYNPLVWQLFGAKWTASRKLPSNPGQAIGAGVAAAAALRNHKVDLAMLHYFGGADADEVATEAQKSGVPVAVLNHYSNDRFLHHAIRKHVMLASGVSGVNGLGLPRYVRNQFTNLSDGIDTDFFRADQARPLKDSPPQPVILLPARVVREKGQMDLVRAVAEIRSAGLDCCIAFAGRSDSSDFTTELKQEIARFGMTDCVHFLGVLNLEQLRDWYAAAAIVALPTYHHEGLPRVILEAHAMCKPVIAYSMGGVADGIACGKTGYLLKPGDVSGLRDRLRSLLSDPALRSTMGAEARKIAEARFSLSALAERHEQFYSGIIMESGTRRA